MRGSLPVLNRKWLVPAFRQLYIQIDRAGEIGVPDSKRDPLASSIEPCSRGDFPRAWLSFLGEGRSGKFPATVFRSEYV